MIIVRVIMADIASGVRRQVWMGNVPLHMTEASVIGWFAQSEVPVPWKVLVRPAANGRSQWAVATFETISDAQHLMTLRLQCPGDGYMVLRPKRVGFLMYVHTRPIIKMYVHT